MDGNPAGSRPTNTRGHSPDLRPAGFDARESVTASACRECPGTSRDEATLSAGVNALPPPPPFRHSDIKCLRVSFIKNCSHSVSNSPERRGSYTDDGDGRGSEFPSCRDCFRRASELAQRYWSRSSSGRWFTAVNHRIGYPSEFASRTDPPHVRVLLDHDIRLQVVRRVLLQGRAPAATSHRARSPTISVS